MNLATLKREVLEANLALVDHGLVVLTWGNVSGIDRDGGVVAIKPSGVPYDRLTADDIVVVDLAGNVVEGALRPSSDLPTHLVLYRAFPSIGGIVHAHSPKAVAWAQAGREIPPFGTTHADHFHGTVPCTRALWKGEVSANYERNTGLAIVERFRDIDAEEIPGVLVSGHGPFSWGPTPEKAVENAVALEHVAGMALDTLALNPGAVTMPQHLLDRHFSRKHGPCASYGQI